MRAGDTMTGALGIAAQGLGPVLAFRDSANTLNRFATNHSDTGWAFNTCDAGGAIVSTAMFVDRTTAKVGISNAAPASYNAVANTAVIGSGVGNQGITIASGAASFGGIHFADGTTGNDPFRGIVYYNHATNEMSLWTDAAQRMTIDANGLMTLGTGRGLSKITVSSSAPGALANGELYLRY